MHRFFSNFAYILLLGMSGMRLLMGKMTNLGYRQLITSLTCDTGSIIDLIFTNYPEDMEVRAGTLPVYYSDHMIIWVAIKS